MFACLNHRSHYNFQFKEPDAFGEAIGFGIHLAALFLRLSLASRLQVLPSCIRSMASSTSSKKLIRIDVSSDTVCPWCLVGKKNLEKATEAVKDQFDFEIRWHPFFLNPNAPKEVKKLDHYKQKFGAARCETMFSRMSEIFRGLGLHYDTSGLTGSTLDCHRLITHAGHQGYDKQNALVDELFLNYHCQGKHIGDRQVLLEAAQKVGIQGAEELLDDPSKGLQEMYLFTQFLGSLSFFFVFHLIYYQLGIILLDFQKVNEELQMYSSNITGVPHFVINGKYNLSGGQPPEVFLRAFQAAANV